VRRLRLRPALLAAAVASFASLALAAPAAHACMGCDGVCEILTSKPVQLVTHSDNCPVR
jgi:hypothetical protein